MQVTVKPSTLAGTMQVPGSKSHTIRAVLLSLLAEGTSRIKNPLSSGDGLSALSASEAFGAEVTKESHEWCIVGTGGKPKVPETCLDTGNSGTTTCFFTSVASLVEGTTVITGDEQIRRRPIGALVNALNTLGSKVFFTRPGKEAPPVVITGRMKGGKVKLDGSNSQFVSSLLLSSPLAENPTEIFVENPLEKPYVAMTLDWMKRYGVEVEASADLSHFIVQNNQTYHAGEYEIPSDWSAVAFPMVAAVLGNSDLVLNGLDFQDSQGDKRVVDVLIGMGANIEKDEKNGKLKIRGNGNLRGAGTIDLGDIPDSLPALAVAASQADGITTFTNLRQVRLKETDRVAEMAEKLNSLGCKLTVGQDSLTVEGPTPIKGGRVNSSDDHRIAMAMVSLGLACSEELVVEDAECVSVSFPGFFEAFKECGARIEMNTDEEAG